MNPEFGVPTLPMEKLFHAISDLIVQVNKTNQALLGQNHTNQNILNHLVIPNHTRPDPKIRPKPFSSLPTEDVLTWLDHFSERGYLPQLVSQ